MNKDRHSSNRLDNIFCALILVVACASAAYTAAGLMFGSLSA
jgi:hypothetical protein